MTFISLIKQDIINLFHTKVVITACTIYPAIMILLFGFFFSGIVGGQGVTSYDYYGVTVMIFMLITSLTITPNTLFEENLKEGNKRIAYAPISRESIYISKLVSSFIFLSIGFSINILVLNMLGIVNFGGENLIYIILLFEVFLIFSVTLGGAIAVIAKSEEVANLIITIVTTAFAILSGVFFPIEQLGSNILKASELCPLKWIINLSFRIIYDNNFKNYTNIILALLFISGISVIVMHFKYKPEDYI